MPKERKKSYSGSLARRVLLVCLVLLVLPLFVHSFFLYYREIRIAEQDVRATLKGNGMEIAQRISELIQIDWKILAAQTPALVKAFQIEQISSPPESGEQFVMLDEEQGLLLVGRRVLNSAYAISHVLKSLLSVENAPFPIEVSLSDEKPSLSKWIESFPIEGTSFSLHLSTSKKYITELQTSYLLFRIGSFILLTVLFGGGAVFLLLRRLARPLSSLCLTMERVSEGAIHSRFVPQVWGFEINGIGQEFNRTLDAMLLHQQEAETQRLHREKLAHELKLGHDIQASLLPKAIPPFHHLDIASGYLPATEVSGDFYDVFPLPSGKVFLAVADIAGKGISACLYSLGLRSSLRALISETSDLAQVARKVNELFLLDVRESGWFATMWLGLYDGKTLHYLCLGHLPALLKRDQQLTSLSTDSPAIGLGPLDTLHVRNTYLQSGDSLLLYTDGVTEAANDDRSLYGFVRLQNSFLASAQKPAAESIDHLLADIGVFTKNHPQQDDLTMLLIKV